MGEDVVGVSMPGAPQEGRLDNLLEPLRKSPEEFQLLHDMQWTIQPVIVPLKDSKVILITGSVSQSESRSRKEQDGGYKGGGEGGRDWGRDGGQEGLQEGGRERRRERGRERGPNQALSRGIRYRSGS